MNMREAVDTSRNSRIWRSLVEATSSANAWRRRNWILFFNFACYSRSPLIGSDTCLQL